MIKNAHINENNIVTRISRDEEVLPGCIDATNLAVDTGWSWTGQEFQPTQEIINRDRENSLAMLWQLYNDFAEKGMDSNSRTSIALLLSQPMSEVRASRINQFMVWWQALWLEYGEKKALLSSGSNVEFSVSVGNCPCSIWQIAE